MKRFGLIGEHLQHSFSENYFIEKFKKESITNCSYANFSLSKINEYSQLIKEINFSGLNVTIPFKEKIIPYLNFVDDEAKVIGAVNCIKFYGDKSTKGFNTDHIGFHKSIMPFLRSCHTHALILGSGGAAKAVAYVLRKLGIEFYFVVRNSVEKNSGHFQYNDLNTHIIKHFKFIINTTPLGMYPEINHFPSIPYEYLGQDHFLYDLIYNPAETEFLKNGKAMGAETQNGLSMLQHQAEKSWEIWNSPNY